MADIMRWLTKLVVLTLLAVLSACGPRAAVEPTARDLFNRFAAFDEFCRAEVQPFWEAASTPGERVQVSDVRYGCVRLGVMSDEWLAHSEMTPQFLKALAEYEEVGRSYALGRIPLEKANQRHRDITNSYFNPFTLVRVVPPEGNLLTGPGCAENGSCYGDLSLATGSAKTVHVGGYYRKDGTYVRGHYRSAPKKRR